MACSNEMQMKALVCVSLSPSASLRFSKLLSLGLTLFSQWLRELWICNKWVSSKITDIRWATSLTSFTVLFFLSLNSLSAWRQALFSCHATCRMLQPDLLLSQGERLRKNCLLSLFFFFAFIFLCFSHGFVPISDRTFWPNMKYTSVIKQPGHFQSVSVVLLLC